MKKAYLSIFLLFGLTLAGCSMFSDSSDSSNQNNSSSSSSIANSISSDLDQSQNTMTNNSLTVTSGMTIAVDYVGKLTDGTLFDTSIKDVAQQAGQVNTGRNYQPLEFIVGAGQMIKGFDSGVIGMKVGETKAITLEPKDAYGEYQDDMIKPMPKKMFDEAGYTPKVGDQFNFGAGTPGTVKAFSGDEIMIDFNHPLAGQTLIFEVTLKNIIKS